MIRTVQVARELENLTRFENLLLAGTSAADETLIAAISRCGPARRRQSETADRPDELLRRAGLGHVASNLASDLSGGQKKLPELARALMLRPRLLLLDEPAARVAPPLVEKLIAFVQELSASGVTFGVVEHSIGLIESLCARIHVLADFGGGASLAGAQLRVGAPRDPPVGKLLAIVNLGFGEAVRFVLLNEAWATCGALGLSGIPRPFGWAFSSEVYSHVFLAICLGVLAPAFLLCEAVARSPLGRVLRAVRDDDAVTAGLGKNVLRLRVVAFGFGGALMGVAGSLHAHYLTHIDPGQFTAIVIAYAVMAVIAGGRGSNRGLILGAGAIMILFEATRFLKDLVPFVEGTQLAALRLGMIGLGIILLLMYRLGGLMTEPRLTPESLRRRSPASGIAPAEG